MHKESCKTAHYEHLLPRRLHSHWQSAALLIYIKYTPTLHHHWLLSHMLAQITINHRHHECTFTQCLRWNWQVFQSLVLFNGWLRPQCNLIGLKSWCIINNIYILIGFVALVNIFSFSVNIKVNILRWVFKPKTINSLKAIVCQHNITDKTAWSLKHP